MLHRAEYSGYGHQGFQEEACGPQETEEESSPMVTLLPEDPPCLAPSQDGHAERLLELLL